MQIYLKVFLDYFLEFFELRSLALSKIEFGVVGVITDSSFNLE
jgi:hypothetical protein